MTHVDDDLLLDFLTGSLEPGRALEVEEALRASAEVRLRLSALSAELRARTAPPPAWRIPPPGLVRGREAPRPHLELPLHLGPEGLKPGDAFDVRIEGVADPERRRIVVLHRERAGWRVVSPADPDEDARLDQIPEASDGGRVLSLVTGPEIGRQRWAVALPLAGVPVDWAADVEARWAWLQAAIAAGDAPVFSVEVDVSGP